MAQIAVADRAAVTKLVRGKNQRNWLKDLLSEGGMKLADYCSPKGTLPRSDWQAMKRFFRKLEEHGYLITNYVAGMPIEMDERFKFVDVSFRLTDFDPCVGGLLVAIYGYIRRTYATAPYWLVRAKAVALRAALATPQEVELAIGLLQMWPDADEDDNDFASLIETTRSLSAQQ